jgi:hypothetical protein
MAAKASLLETIALAAIPQSELIPKLAMLWRRQLKESYDPEQEELVSWVEGRWGPLFPAGEETRWARLLNDEIELQQRRVEIKDKRGRAYAFDGNGVPLWDNRLNVRRGRLLLQILGPPHKWVATRHLTDGIYFTGHISLDFVAGLVSTKVASKSGGGHRLLVYRQGKNKPLSYWVGSHIIKLRDAIEWLKKPVVVRAERAGARVVFDGQRQDFRLIYPNGRITRVKWKKIREYC